MIRSRPHALAACVCLAAVPMAVQAAPPMTAFAEASVTDLQWRLVDLAPDDGITPTLQSNSTSLRYGVSSIWGSQRQTVPVAPLPEATDTATVLPGNEAIVSPGRITARSTQVEAYRLPAGADPARVLDPDPILDQRDAYIEDEGSFHFPSPDRITLSPHTQLVIEGRASLNVMAYADGGVMADTMAPIHIPYDHEVLSRAGIFATFTGTQPDVSKVTSFDAYLQVRDAFDGPGNGSPGAALSNQEEQPFRVTLDNISDADLEASLLWSVYSSVRGHYIPAANVPEPSVWCLALSGVLLAARARRQRAREVSR